VFTGNASMNDWKWLKSNTALPPRWLSLTWLLRLLSLKHLALCLDLQELGLQHQLLRLEHLRVHLLLRLLRTLRLSLTWHPRALRLTATHPRPHRHAVRWLRHRES
jgi:hypothetical protein